MIYLNNQPYNCSADARLNAATINSQSKRMSLSNDVSTINKTNLQFVKIFKHIINISVRLTNKI